jgi:hypothetical protein
MASSTQHWKAFDSKLNHHTSSASDGSGGKCLNRCEGRKQNCSCSHTWQGYLKATETSDLYNWPKYKGIGAQTLMFRRKPKEGESATVMRQCRAPREGDWNVGVKYCKRKNGKVNFLESANFPYYHEAHHMVPNSVLNGVISLLFGEPEAVLVLFRKGLMDEEYNLNYKVNMIILPLEEVIADAIGLPRHRQTNAFDHKVYSKKVKTKLKKILSSNQQEIRNHDDPKYTACKAQIEALSEDLFGQIKRAGHVGVLNDMKLRFRKS